MSNAADSSGVFWLAAFSIVSGHVTWLDIHQRRVSNRLLLAAAIFQFLWLATHLFVPSLVMPIGWRAVVMTRWPPALATAAVAFVVLFPLWRFRAMGAGDVKFAVVLGFCTGPLGLMQAFLAGSLLAGVHAVLYLLQREAPWLLGRLSTYGVSESTPYAAYLALSALAGMAWQVLDGQPWLPRLVHWE